MNNCAQFSNGVIEVQDIKRYGRIRVDYDPAFSQRYIRGKTDYCPCLEPLSSESLPPIVRAMAADLVRLDPYSIRRQKHWDVTAAEWKAIRWLVFWLDQDTCMYCGAPATTTDHIIPVVRGGSYHPENCVSACRRCNSRKGCRTPSEAGMELAIW